MVTDRAAATLNVMDRYGIDEGKPANLLLLPALDTFDLVRRQVRPSHVISRGRIVATTPASTTTLQWPGREPEFVDGVRMKDAAGASWRGEVKSVS